MFKAILILYWSLGYPTPFTIPMDDMVACKKAATIMVNPEGEWPGHIEAFCVSSDGGVEYISQRKQ